MSKRYCPHCKSDMRGEKIPEIYAIHTEGDGYYYRYIGVEVPELYDGIWYFYCPDCNGSWPAEVQLLKANKFSSQG